MDHLMERVVVVTRIGKFKWSFELNFGAETHVCSAEEPSGL